MEIKETKKNGRNWIKELIIILVGVMLLVLFNLRADAAENTWSNTFTVDGKEFHYYYITDFNSYKDGNLQYTFHRDEPMYFINYKAGSVNVWAAVSFSNSSILRGGKTYIEPSYRNGLYKFSSNGSGITTDYPIEDSENNDQFYLLDKFIEYMKSDDFEEYQPPLPDLDEMLKESNYGLKNFYADNKINASWAGMYYNNRVQEHVGLHIEFSYRGMNSDFIEVDSIVYENDFGINDLSFYIPWDDVCSNDENYYLRSMHVTPIGKDKDGNYIHGSTETVFYDNEGKLTDISAVQNSLANSYDNIVHGGGTDRIGTKILTDFYLKNVVVKRGILSSSDVVKWEGCTNNIDYLTVPDKDTLVICSVILYDANGDIYVEDYDSTTIGSGSMRVDWNKLYEKYKDSEYLWTGEIRIAPCYVLGHCLFIGQQTSIDIFQGTVLNEGIDEDGELVIEDVTDSNISDSNKDSIFDNASDFLNDTESISKYTSLFFGFLTNLVSLMGQVPNLFAHVFSFLPSVFIDLIGMTFIVALICRVLGR